MRIAIHGAAGRMGLRLIALASRDDQLQVAAAIDRPGHPAAGRDIGELAGVGPIGVNLTDKPAADVDMMVDFSTPTAMRGALSACADAGIPFVSGTTGLSGDDQQALDAASKRIAVLYASNFSLVVNVLNRLAAEAAALLGQDYDIEILEAHHRFKKDAPSGTAIMLARTVCGAAGGDFDRDVIYTRHGDDVPRRPGQITVQSLRIGDHPGEHTLYFAAPGERLELRHVSTSRDSYVLGALRAAKWLGGKPAGRYGMAHVLGL